MSIFAGVCSLVTTFAHIFFVELAVDVVKTFAGVGSGYVFVLVSLRLGQEVKFSTLSGATVGIPSIRSLFGRSRSLLPRDAVYVWSCLVPDRGALRRRLITVVAVRSRQFPMSFARSTCSVPVIGVASGLFTIVAPVACSALRVASTSLPVDSPVSVEVLFASGGEYEAAV